MSKIMKPEIKNISKEKKYLHSAQSLFLHVEIIFHQIFLFSDNF